MFVELFAQGSDVLVELLAQGTDVLVELFAQGTDLFTQCFLRMPYLLPNSQITIVDPVRNVPSRADSGEQ